MKIWVAIWDHSSGEEIYAYRREHIATQEMCKIIVEDITTDVDLCDDIPTTIQIHEDDLCDEYKEVLAAYKQGDYNKALEIWGKYQEEKNDYEESVLITEIDFDLRRE